MVRKVAKKVRKRVTAHRLLAFLMAAVMTLSGCTAMGIDELESEVRGNGGVQTDDLREGAQAAKEKAADGAEAVREQGEKIVDAAGAGISKTWLKACLILRGWAAFIVVTSLLLGFALTEIFPKNAEIRKFGILTLSVRVPLATVILTYAAAFLYGVASGRRTVLSEASALPGGVCVAWYEFSRRVSVPTLVACALCMGIGIFLSERYRDNPDVVRTARRYLCVRVPLAAFLAFVAYPLMYSLFA